MDSHAEERIQLTWSAPAPSSQDSAARLSFVACASDEEVLRSNLLASPSLAPESGHEAFLVKNCPSAANGLNLGLARSSGEWVIGVHQDVFLPQGWDRRLALQIREAERRFGPVGVAGVYGVGPAMALSASLAAQRIGRVVDRGRLLCDGPGLPALAATLDELLLVVRRDSALRFDPRLGFHLYGADICLQAAELGLPVVVIDALCHHNSRSVGLPKAFYKSAQVFARKWAHRLPVATPCVIIDRQGRVHILGNATGQTGSIAYTLPTARRGVTEVAELNCVSRSWEGEPPGEPLSH
jgi:Glycosyltransferase like family